jgi:hypothetical protein
MPEPRRRRSDHRAAREVQDHKPRFLGWRTSDEDEIERRRLRAEAEDLAVRDLEPACHPYGTFAVVSGTGDGEDSREYRVEIRSLAERWNTCNCPDHRVNGLGTCKHLEAVLRHLARDDGARDGGPEAAASPGRRRPRVEVFLDRTASPPEARILRPPGRPSKKVEELVAPFFGTGGTLLAPPEAAVPALARRLDAAPRSVRQGVRLSAELPRWAAEEARRAERRTARERFLADVQAGKRSLDVLHHRLYSYQEEGALHLAFAERALLGDEMGLGKTVQAIAACELLRRLRGIERVLVICPVSLKAEWEEQIAKFTDLPVLTVLGRRQERLRCYREQSFFYLVNYEQVLADGEELQRLLAPDAIVLDEAQRIKNWRTKTAQAVKRLESRYAFVLTGTPLENRIDDLYSIVQLLDARIFGPLFRFNRDFHELDEHGRPVGYKNLAELHRRLRQVLLRRRKADVEDQLPERTVNTYFVPMHKEQEARYADFEGRVAKLASIAKRRPLTRQEFEKLQRNLACMRMICDTPYILDPECRVCPKLGELESVLEELLDEDGQKVLVFSEWQRMLELVRELAEEMGVGFAWHTGSVPQNERRLEVRRFKDDPDCRLFLSTDSGGLGLNLQAASAVVNLDLPWNPARLEQRIARAWRKHQRRAVKVIHLVTEGSIEHRMLGLLAGKQTLAEGVLDGRDGVDEMPLPSGRAVFLERLEELLEERLAGAKAAKDEGVKAAGAAEAAGLPAPERLRQDLMAVLGERLLLLDLVPAGASGHETVVAVVDRLDGASGDVRRDVEASVRRAFGEAAGDEAGTPRLELLDRATYETLVRLAEAGVVTFSTGGELGDGEPLHRAAALGQRQDAARRRRLAEARELLAEGERKLRMATLLGEHGFGAEAAAPLGDALGAGLRAVAHLAGMGAGIEAGTEEERATELGPRLEPRYGRPAAEAARLLALLQAMQAEGLAQAAGAGQTEEWLQRGQAHFRALEEILDRAALRG